MYKIIDSHCHIYPKKIAGSAVAATSSFYDGLSMEWDGTFDTLIKSGNEAGIDHFIVNSVATTPKQVSDINRFIAKTVAESNGKMTGLGTLHPDSADIKADFEEILLLGLKGVKLHPDIQKFKIDDYRALKIYELCEGKIPICMHTGDSRYDFSNPNRLKPVIEIFTELTVVAAHLGGWSVWDQATQQLSNLKNLYVDISSSLYWLSPKRAREIVMAYGVDKVLFGTDYPMWSQKKEIQRVLAMGLTVEENKKIFYKNAAKLYKICTVS